MIDYLMDADKRPYRLVDIGGKLHTVDAFDLQKLPVRVLLFLKFVHLEALVARSLCLKNPGLLEILTTDRGVDSAALGSMGTGPLRKIETYYFQQLLRDAEREKIIGIEDAEVTFLNGYRNRLVHGPRWYITRRSEVQALVRCVKRVSELTLEVAKGLEAIDAE